MALSLEQYKSRWTECHKMKDILLERLDRRRESPLVVSIENGDSIPEPLIVEILSWLPVQVLLRFKTVCKLWYSIIKSSNFISKHLKNYYDNNDSRDCLIVQYYITQACEINTYELLVDDKSNQVLSYQKIDTPFYNAYICGPCDGLFFLWRDYLSPCHSLWNPTLNEFARLPNLILKPNLPSYMSSSCMAYGFGFDSKTRDYKVIVIQYHRDVRVEYSNICDHPISIFIYSLKSNSWKYWGEPKISYYLEQNESYVFVHGCYHWLGAFEPCSSDYEVVLSFNLTAEAYEEIRLPKFEKKPGYGSQLVIFHDSVGFVCIPDSETNFCIWTWNEGVWTQKLYMEVGFQARGAFSHCWDNMIVFRQARGSLILCDTDTTEIWTLDDPQAGHTVFHIMVYRESLVSIKKLVVYNEKLALNEIVEIPEQFWPEEVATVEIPDWFMFD